jgi:hypothetical protein
LEIQIGQEVFHGSSTHGSVDRRRGPPQERLRAQEVTPGLPLGRLETQHGIPRLAQRLGLAMDLPAS